MKLPRPHDPAKLALRGGLRTALVLPIVFAITKLWWGEPRASVIAAFGTIALLVFADFGGPMRARIPAYLGTAAAGFALIPLATVCSRSTVAATLVMAVVAFLVLYSGIVDGYVATAGPAVLLVFVVSLMIPAGADAIGPRLGGWALACAFGDHRAADAVAVAPAGAGARRGGAGVPGDGGVPAHDRRRARRGARLGA